MTTATATTTLTQLFLERAKASPDRVALRRKVDGKWEDISWQGYFDAACKIGLGLQAIGLQRGDRVAILAETRAEWAFCDLGILGVGGITVPIYHSNLPDEVKYILDNAETKYLFLENLDQWRKIQPQLDDLTVERYVIFETDDTETTTAADAPWEGNEKVVSLDAFIEQVESQDKAAFEAACAEAKPSDPITYIYTSGTTGHPKGVVLTHACGIGEAEALVDALPLTEDDSTLAFLPLAHVFARALHWTQIKVGYQVAFAEAIPKVVDNMGEVSPTFFAAVPRIYEKLHAAVLKGINAGSSFSRSYALMALGSAMEQVRLNNAGKNAGLGVSLKSALGGPALGKIKTKLKGRTGGRIKFFISGGAPLSPEIAYFLSAMDFNIFEGYGLTETTAATHINRPGACKLGTVGKVVKGCECRLAPEDSEVLVRGPVIMKEYFKRDDATAEVMQEMTFDGKTETWFRTGDIGVIDEEGFLKITDRKKDILITAAGKNIAPQNVENHVKTHPLVSQVALFGDKKKFCVALITVDEEAARAALSDEGVDVPADLKALTEHPRLKELLQQAIEEKNEALPQYETIKYFEILPKDFDIGDELTPTMKVKRRVVKDKYGDLVEALYAAHGG